METLLSILLALSLSLSIPFSNVDKNDAIPSVTPSPVTPTPDTPPPSTGTTSRESTYGVGSGGIWESGLFIPFADMCLWVSDASYSNSGAIDLARVMDESGTRYFNLGFINAIDHTVNDGILNWGFGGFSVLNQANRDNEQYQGILKSIADVRAKGGDVTVSVGGLNERNFFQYSDDVNVLTNTYLEIIQGFGLTRLDLDIEGSAQGYAMNATNAKAIKQVQDATGVEIVLTLPVLPTGLTENFGLPTLKAYLDAGVEIEAVNIMAMCYGSYFGDYAQGSVEAIDSTMAQIQTAYQEIGIPLTQAQAYEKVAVTTSIGYEGWGHPIFTTADSKLVVDHARKKGVNFVSFWSINRDSQVQDNEGIYQAYEHSKIYGEHTVPSF